MIIQQTKRDILAHNKAWQVNCKPEEAQKSAPE